MAPRAFGKGPPQDGTLFFTTVRPTGELFHPRAGPARRAALAKTVDFSSLYRPKECRQKVLMQSGGGGREKNRTIFLNSKEEIQTVRLAGRFPYLRERLFRVDSPAPVSRAFL